jgi:predicted MPP superfamily phosphohydrolase
MSSRTGSVNFFKKNYFQTFKIFPTASDRVRSTRGDYERCSNTVPTPPKAKKVATFMVIDNHEYYQTRERSDHGERHANGEPKAITGSAMRMGSRRRSRGAPCEWGSGDDSRQLGRVSTVSRMTCTVTSQYKSRANKAGCQHCKQTGARFSLF